MSFIVAVEVVRGRGIGPFIRCAVAFGAKLMVVVGSDKYGTHGAHGSQSHMDIVHFFDWTACLSYLLSKNYSLYTITPNTLLDTTDQNTSSCTSEYTVFATSQSIETVTFANPKAVFIIGDTCCLSSEQLSLTSAIVHVPCLRLDLEGCIKYETKLAICLNHFMGSFSSAKQKASFQGEKYFVDRSENIFSLAEDWRKEYLEMKAYSKSYYASTNNTLNGIDPGSGSPSDSNYSFGESGSLSSLFASAD